jgi:hypothetical protein
VYVDVHGERKDSKGARERGSRVLYVKVEVAHAGESRKGIFGAQGTGAGEYKGLLKQGTT